MIIFNVNNLRSFATLISLHAGGWMVEKTAINRHLGLARLGLGRVESRQSDRGEGGGERREFLSLSLSLSLSFSLVTKVPYVKLQKSPMLPKFPIVVTKVP